MEPPKNSTDRFEICSRLMWTVISENRTHWSRFRNGVMSSNLICGPFCGNPAKCHIRRKRIDALRP
jgi:hypothetical protein